MTRPNVLALSTAVALASLGYGIGHAQQGQNEARACFQGSVQHPCERSLKDELVGTWTLVSCDETLGNAKPRYCINPNGILMLDAGGRYVMLIAAGGRPGGVRATSAAEAPAEIVKAVAQGLLANYGTWSVNEADKTITRHVEGALFPSIEGVDLTATITLNGDALKFTGQGGARLFRRAKDAVVGSLEPHQVDASPGR